jgi:(E)-4-hydroxy-3-methylbut-2-enyl-diphosphate synthase
MLIRDYIKRFDFCENLFVFKRRKSREVFIGGIPLGANHPIRIQSMTNTLTSDIEGSVKQVIRLAEAGCDYVRLTVPTLKDVSNMEVIIKKTRQMGFNIPFIADVHYNPSIALKLVGIVEKVRINPGNYADTKSLKPKIFSDQEYQFGLDNIREKITPFILKCQEYGTAVRIGTNHGSLSDRILSRYGNTTVGMVESAMEYLRICTDLNFHKIILSMKASSPKVMVEAYRLLVAKMNEEGMDYPLHLGVTEAGEGEDGIIKSSIGIGALLEDGLGDTIRVSLTADPVSEIPVAKEIAEKYDHKQNHSINLEKEVEEQADVIIRHMASNIQNIRGNKTPVVITNCINPELNDLNTSINTNVKPDFLATEDGKIIQIESAISGIKYLEIENSVIDDQLLTILKNDPSVLLVLNTSGIDIHNCRKIIWQLGKAGITNPLILQSEVPSQNNSLVEIATKTGCLLVDGIGDGIWIKANHPNKDNENCFKTVKLSFDILQACQRRIFKTEYVTCPSCGRTLFDIEKTAFQVKEKTGHLKGLKIGVMGCIVNGLGEMGDADYGFVGSGKGKISLYRNKELVKRDIPEQDAVEELIRLLKTDGKWE